MLFDFSPFLSLEINLYRIERQASLKSYHNGQ